MIALLWIAASAANTNAQERKALFVLVDGIPADVIERLQPPHLNAIIAEGGYARAIMGGTRGGYSETPTVSAVGYNSLLTGTWANKHNVWDNDIAAPNYRYWSIFRFLRERYPSKMTGIFSSWLDNRTKLVGANLAETNYFAFDIRLDGLELDTLNFPHDERDEYIHAIDDLVATEAADAVRREAPDLSWVYLWYPDAVAHRFGDGEEMDEAVLLADEQIGRIWEAIQYRQEQHNEEWLLIVTTDHGRTEEDGRGHGGQTDRERRIWIVTNSSDTNAYFEATPAIVDIMPSIARFMNIPIPQDRAMELDGIPVIGSMSASNLKAERSGDEAIALTWKAWSDGGTAKAWIATTNEFRDGGADHYLLMDQVELAEERAVVSLPGPVSGFYKVVLETPDGFLNYWLVPD